MRLGADHVRVTVPATSANLGPGFDALGLALGRHDTVEVRAIGAAETVVEVIGEGAGEVPLGEDHLVVRALRAAIDLVGAPQTGLHMVCRNEIPHGRGMGSSAAAVVAGIVAARALIASADVVVENFRPGVMDRLGLGATAMTEANPRLIYCSLPGFASDDPRAGMPAWEGIVGAAAVAE